jgi:alkaline phosphatase D
MKLPFVIASGIFLTICLSSCTPEKKSGDHKLTEPVVTLYDTTLKPFYHGVASGDPLTDRVIIWTRVTPEDSLADISVKWEIADNENFSPLLQSDSLSTSPEKDYTVKIDVTGLDPGKFYYYRFRALGRISIVGRTKTLAANGVDSVKLAVVSCANWEFGYFNAFDRIADRDVDAVVHLGDYIYEYATGVYGNKSIDRKHLPAHEAVSLQDYRTRYSQYHLDAGLRHARQQHPFITIWDDHEIANNAYKDGAQNHQADKEGAYASRKAAATQAYYEWIPIRENNNLYRSFSFGNLVDLIMLDERLAGRTKQADSLSDPLLKNKDQTMLGQQQLTWLEQQLSQSKAVWKVIGNQVIFSDVDESSVHPKNPKNLDSWDGYPVEQKKIADFIQSNSIKDIIFLAGDSHASWAFEVAFDPAKKISQPTSPLAVELGVTSISSGNWNESAPDDTVKRGEEQLLKGNPHLKYTNQRDHGYLLLTLFPDKAKSEWYFIETLKEPDPHEHRGRRFDVLKGTNHLKDVQ